MEKVWIVHGGGFGSGSGRKERKRESRYDKGSLDSEEYVFTFGEKVLQL
jgi:hypothetical protein